MSNLFQDGLKQLIDGQTLSRESARLMMDHIMGGRATSNQISSFLTALRFRGETAEELTGFTESLRRHADRLVVRDFDVLDTCGTGGDGASTFNISTATAILLSGMGVKVAKHGNRAVSSKSGSADVIEALGIPIPGNKREALEQLETVGMCFLFAPDYHASMKYAATPRKELGFRTIFNLLGPLANPAGSHYQLLGVYNESSARKMAEALKELGTEKALLVTGDGGMDEVAITGPSRLFEVSEGSVTSYTIVPEDVGLKRGRLSDIQVANVQESAILIEKIFSGRANPTASDIVCLNAGSALYVVGRAKDIANGVDLAKQALLSGVGFDQLNRMRAGRKEGLRHA
ncbi:MAG: anthranilate phosphoribosyltransferase [Tuberibacillus sp.]